MALVIEVDHFQTQTLADQLVEIADRLAANLRCRNESAHAQVDENAALDDLRYGGFDHFIALVRFDDFFPRFERARTTLRQEQRSVEIVDAVNHDFERIADFEELRLDGER